MASSALHYRVTALAGVLGLHWRWGAKVERGRPVRKMLVIQVRDHGSSDQVRAVEVVKKGQAVGVFLTAATPTDFSDEMDVKYERNRVIKTGFENFGLGN